jgi:hypothetical protein
MRRICGSAEGTDAAMLDATGSVVDREFEAGRESRSTSRTVRFSFATRSAVAMMSVPLGSAKSALA